MNILRVILPATFALGLLAAALADTHYVAQAGQTPVEPYTNDWPSAASNIQAAVDQTVDGDTVLVSNGVYDTGATYYTGSNRVYITKKITVRSANNDPAHTTIKGAWDPNTNGPAAVRCVYMARGSSLIGFTITNGATLATSCNGGGISASGAIVSNCIIEGNATSSEGGGVIFGSIYNCTIRGNLSWSSGGGAGACPLLCNCLIVSNRATYGAGALDCTILSNCTLIGNYASLHYGGGVANGILYNCLLVGNGNVRGGGAYNSTLYNCTVVGNSSGGGPGGGIDGGRANNCIVYFNHANGSASNYSGAVFTNSCTAPVFNDWAFGNITNDPVFVDQGSGYGTNHVAGIYRLSPVSPCVNTGTNMDWMTNACDLDNRQRVRYGRVDMGCYEFISKGSMMMFR